MVVQARTARCLIPLPFTTPPCNDLSCYSRRCDLRPVAHSGGAHDFILTYTVIVTERINRSLVALLGASLMIFCEGGSN
jgi:hypothetical protein